MKKEERAKYITELYENSAATNLSDVYGRYSARKVKAWQYCKDLMNLYNGENLKILSHNTYMFTAAFEFANEECQCMLMYITPTKNEIVEWCR